jgi:mono/diheme cytochrome c family protein
MLIAAAASAGFRCDQMADQPRYEPYEACDMFRDGSSARRPVPGTIARGHARLDRHLYTGMIDGRPADTFPFAITEGDLRRGQERFVVNCSHCHGLTGEGDGIVVQRGFPQPPSYHSPRLRAAPVGHFFDVITNGYGAMYSHNDRVDVMDRWRIAAYIRALQLSQHARVADLPEKDRARLEEAAP